MKTETAFIIGKHEYSYKKDMPAEIIGVKIITPEGLPPRICFQVKYPDGDIDFIPMHDTKNYEIASFNQLAPKHKTTRPFHGMQIPILKFLHAEKSKQMEYAKAKPNEKKRIIFHGGCHGCTTPLNEGLKGCFMCEYFNGLGSGYPSLHSTNQIFKNNEMESIPYNHDTPMTFGKYRLYKLKDLPRSYLLELYNNRNNAYDRKILDYIERNLAQIQTRSDTPLMGIDNLPNRERRAIYTNCEKLGFPNKKEANYALRYIKSNPKTGKTPIRSYECDICGAWHHTSKEKKDKNKFFTT